jgi:hypothetical protein
MAPSLFPASQGATVYLLGFVTFAKSALSLPSAAMPARLPSPLKLSTEVACNHKGPYDVMMHTTQNGREPSWAVV